MVPFTLPFLVGGEWEQSGWRVDAEWMEEEKNQELY